MKQFIKDFKTLNLYDKIILIISLPASMWMLVDYFYLHLLVSGV